MLFMVEEPQYGGKETVLRSINELQPGGTVKHVIPHRLGCAYTLFQSKPATPCQCSNLLLMNILTLERFHFGPIEIAELI